MKNAIKNMHSAKAAKDDEFYTQYKDIEKEMVRHNKEVFSGKTIYLNCDNPKTSQFYLYFKNNFDNLNLKQVIATHYTKGVTISEVTRLTKTGTQTTFIESDGDFNDPILRPLYEESDIVITNPPFSRIRQWFDSVRQYKKDFLIIGPLLAVSYKTFFNALVKQEIFVSNHENLYFLRPNNNPPKKVCICWFSTFESVKAEKVVEPSIEYDPALHPFYDNDKIIEVSRITKIPRDYYEVMGVPITYLIKHNPFLFDILGLSRPILNGKKLFLKVLIKRRIESLEITQERKND